MFRSVRSIVPSVRDFVEAVPAALELFAGVWPAGADVGTIATIARADAANKRQGTTSARCRALTRLIWWDLKQLCGRLVGLSQVLVRSQKTAVGKILPVALTESGS